MIHQFGVLIFQWNGPQLPALANLEGLQGLPANKQTRSGDFYTVKDKGVGTSLALQKQRQRKQPQKVSPSTTSNRSTRLSALRRSTFRSSPDLLESLSLVPFPV